jgi:transketolase
MAKKKDEWIDDVKRVSHGIRKRVLEHTINNGGGYLSQACSSADLISTLYIKAMNLESLPEPLVPGQFPGVPGPNNKSSFTGANYNGPKAPHLDRFFVSPAQYALIIYAALVELGRMSESGLKEFNRDGGVVEMIGAEHSPGMEVMTGSLGQGISQAAGVALARKLKGDTGRVFVFMSDGEFQSGQTLEALQAMAFHNLDNMVVYVDVNGCQADGLMESVMNIEPFDKRVEAFGIRTFKIDGHDIEKLAEAAGLESDGRPTVVLCYTDPSHGIPLIAERSPKFHYTRFTSEDEKSRYKAFLDTM